MKKLLVLALVVSMLAVTGSAFAADDPAGHGTEGDDAGGHGTPTTNTVNVTSADVSKALANTGYTSADAETIATAIKGVSTSLTDAQVNTLIANVAAAAAKSVTTMTATIANTSAATALTDSSVKVFSASDVTSPDASVVAAAVKLALIDTTLSTPVVLPTIKASSLSTDQWVQFTLYNPTTGSELTGRNSVKFYNNAGTALASSDKNMYIASYRSAKLDDIYGSTSIASHGIKSSDTYAVVRFKYNGNPTTGVAAAGDLNLVLAGSSTTPSTSGSATTPGSSGGGCVAGTSAAALALAVLGFVTAKRRA
jgi:hypothetical protein